MLSKNSSVKLSAHSSHVSDVVNDAANAPQRPVANPISVNIAHGSIPAPSQPKPSTPLSESQYASTAAAP